MKENAPTVDENKTKEQRKTALRHGIIITLCVETILSTVYNGIVQPRWPKSSGNPGEKIKDGGLQLEKIHNQQASRLQDDIFENNYELSTRATGDPA